MHGLGAEGLIHWGRTVWAGDQDEIQRREDAALEISARMDVLGGRIRAAREQDG